MIAGFAINSVALMDYTHPADMRKEKIWEIIYLFQTLQKK